MNSAGEHGDDAERNAEIGEGGHQADALHEPAGHGRGDQGSNAEASDGDAGDEAAAVGKPFDENGDGNDITHAEAGASDDAVGEIKQPQLMGGKAGQKDAAAPEQTADDGDDPRAEPVQTEAADRGHAAEEEPGYVEGERDLSDAPAEFFYQRDAKHAPGVGGA